MEHPASAYFMEERHDANETHTLSVLLQNEPGVLARVIGLFSGRGYNIDSLTVAPVDDDGHRSRINIVTSGAEMVIEQIKAQLDRPVPVHTVHALSLARTHLTRARLLTQDIAATHPRPTPATPDNYPMHSASACSRG